MLRQTRADVIALQEVETLKNEPGLLDYFCRDSDWQHIHGPTLEREDGDYGNAILTSLPVRSLRRIDISQRRREPRGAFLVTLADGERSLNLLATHLGLRPWERRAQTRILLEELRQHAGSMAGNAVTILMGDLNEWFLWGRPIRFLRRYFGSSPAPATWPARFPFFALDRVWVEPRQCLLKVGTVDTPLARIASDHLPLVAELASGRPEQAPKHEGAGDDHAGDDGQYSEIGGRGIHHHLEQAAGKDGQGCDSRRQAEQRTEHELA